MNAATLQKPCRLTCCCCAAGTVGRQWWNRDTGYGLCETCADWIESRATPPEEMRSLYGIKGTHYAITEASITEAS